MAASASIIETSLLLCEVIEDWQLTNAHNNDGRLDWDAITLKMVDKTGKPVQRSDLQTVWKYIAYGKRKIRPEGNGEAITYSDDEEPFHQPFSAVKRHKTHTAIQLQKMEAIKKGGTLSPELIAQRHILASTIPEAMRSDLLCRKIQINIPDHVRLGFVGIQPPIYVPSSEMTLATKYPPHTKAPRNPRVAHLAALGNDKLSTGIRFSALHPVNPLVRSLGGYTGAAAGTGTGSAGTLATAAANGGNSSGKAAIVASTAVAGAVLAKPPAPNGHAATVQKITGQSNATSSIAAVAQSTAQQPRLQSESAGSMMIPGFAVLPVPTLQVSCPPAAVAVPGESCVPLKGNGMMGGAGLSAAVGPSSPSFSPSPPAAAGPRHAIFVAPGPGPATSKHPAVAQLRRPAHLQAGTGAGAHHSNGAAAIAATAARPAVRISGADGAAVSGAAMPSGGHTLQLGSGRRNGNGNGVSPEFLATVTATAWDSAAPAPAGAQLPVPRTTPSSSSIELLALAAAVAASQHTAPH